jgi:hypothetical protein
MIFVTESHPGGSWWWVSKHGNQESYSVSEDQFLERCRFQIRHLMKEALTTRVFGVACGMNLYGPNTIELIRKTLLP